MKNVARLKGNIVPKLFVATGDLTDLELRIIDDFFHDDGGCAAGTCLPPIAELFLLTIITSQPAARLARC